MEHSGSEQQASYAQPPDKPNLRLWKSNKNQSNKPSKTNLLYLELPIISHNSTVLMI